jgi:tetratricopeptide (TPR) repeat protein
MRLNPHYPAVYLTDIGHAYYLTGQYEKAMAALRRALIRKPDFLPTHAYLAAVYSELGREDEAGAEMAEVVRLVTGVPPREHMPYKDPAVLQRLRDAWFKPRPLPSGSVRSESGIPLPTTIRIEPPVADLPPEVAAFSGTWEGRWEGDVQGRLAVERIDAEWARVVYAWGDDPGGRFKGGWERVPAKVLPGGRLQSVDEALKTTLTFEMAQDRMSIQGEHDAAGRVTKVRMQRVGPLP